MKMEGIITPIVTPFYRNSNQSINKEALKVLIEYLIAHGVNGIFVLGSNGEFHTLNEDEKIELVQEVVKIVNHRVMVYAGSGSCSTKEAISLSRKMEELGADALSIVPPYFLKPSRNEIIQYYKDIAENVHIPIMIYNIPKGVGYSLDMDIVDELADIELIQGIKDSSGNEELLKKYADIAKRKNISLLIGSDSKIAYGYELGASGAVAGTSNVIVDTVVKLDKALKNKDMQLAEKLQNDINIFRRILPLGSIPSVIKRALELSVIAVAGPARKPVLELPDSSDYLIKETLAYFNLNK